MYLWVKCGEQILDHVDIAVIKVVKQPLADRIYAACVGDKFAFEYNVVHILKNYRILFHFIGSFLIISLK